MPVRYFSHLFVILIVIFSIVPNIVTSPVAVAAPDAVATPVQALLSPATMTRELEERSTVSSRTSFIAATPVPTPLPTPVAIDPNATPLAPPTPPPVVIAPREAVLSAPGPVPTPPPVANIVGTVFPVDGTIVQYWSAGHPALDIVAPCNANVVATLGGEVVYSGWKDNGGGNVVSVQTALGLMEYNHLNAVATTVGTIVSTGQLVGYVGATGWATGCHVHFAVLQGGVWVDPLVVL